MVDFGFGWRVIEGPRGYLDVTAGVRYMNIYQRTHASTERRAH
jgi:hypothetical protein